MKRKYKEEYGNPEVSILKYRNFEYSKEFKKDFKRFGLKIKQIIDNYLDNNIYKYFIYKDDYIYELVICKHNMQITKKSLKEIMYEKR